jgi:hypothetical protein
MCINSRPCKEPVLCGNRRSAFLIATHIFTVATVTSTYKLQAGNLFSSYFSGIVKNNFTRLGILFPTNCLINKD